MGGWEDGKNRAVLKSGGGEGGRDKQPLVKTRGVRHATEAYPFTGATTLKRALYIDSFSKTGQVTVASTGDSSRNSSCKTVERGIAKLHSSLQDNTLTKEWIFRAGSYLPTANYLNPLPKVN